MDFFSVTEMWGSKYVDGADGLRVFPKGTRYTFDGRVSGTVYGDRAKYGGPETRR